MNGTGRLLLAGTAFPGNQHRHIHFRRFLNAPKQGLHDGAVTDQPVLGFRLALLAQGGFGQIDHAVGVPKRHHQARGINGQGMIITAALGDDADNNLRSRHWRDSAMTHCILRRASIRSTTHWTDRPARN